MSHVAGFRLKTDDRWKKMAGPLSSQETSILKFVIGVIVIPFSAHCKKSGGFEGNFY